MKTHKSPFKTNVLLWWVAIIALIASGMLYYMLGPQAETDVHIRQQRLMLPVVGVLIAGICLIAGTAGRWFDSK